MLILLAATKKGRSVGLVVFFRRVVPNIARSIIGKTSGGFGLIKIHINGIDRFVGYRWGDHTRCRRGQLSSLLMKVRTVKAGCNHRNDQLVVKLWLKRSTKDNVGVRRNRAGNDLGSLLDFAHAHIVATGYVKQ